MTMEVREQAWSAFLQRWPIESLSKMKLSEYVSAGSKDSFTYWLEFGEGKRLGSIRGGDSSKLGIYERKNSPKGERVHIAMDDVYSWKLKYGKSAAEAFKTIRDRIKKVALAACAGDLKLIQSIDLENALKWKVAFIYQDQTAPTVLPIYKYSKLCDCADVDEGELSQAELYGLLMKERGDSSVLEYGFKLWRESDIDEHVELHEDRQPEKVNHLAIPKNSLNQILFGPPGTGKTYSSIDAALKVLAPEFWAEHQHNRAALKDKFDELAQAERILFVTFHQSFSYEDFVEGLRASTDGEHLSYRVESGVLKQLCERARYVSGTLTEDDVIENFLDNISKQPMMLTTVTGKAFEVRYKVGNTTITCIPQASAAELALPANIEHIRSMMRGAEPSNLYCASYVKAIAQHLSSQLTEHVGAAVNNTQPYVLIIDEINRGNISRIFGELITLIEPSKRAGAPEALTVTLPYSKEPFSVPNNVYLIGTMNTSDRSLAGMDIALRRRFEFVEMPPQSELLRDVWVEGVNIGELLTLMNQRIEVLLGRDYQLGHAYFMPLKKDATLSRLDLIFRNQILPLLQEYFFEDWQRIAWVLNDHRKPEADQFVQLKKNRLSELFGNAVSVPNNGEVWQINTDAFGRITAYSGVISAVNAKDPEATPAESEA